ncbi:MAG: type II toxin-antitoxin system ParD family antitoxin [Gammaproteobacteria bacterium]|nr:MAG: type II toxin-antitoxin system ParD family antitoxin [Gammaproteobacteria bacterium]
MNISLTPKLECLVKQKVDAGLYNSASEVIREALRLMEERDQVQQLKLQALKDEISLGLESLEAGKGNTLDIEAIKAKGRKELGRK